MQNRTIQTALKFDTMRRLIALMADGFEVHDLMEAYQMSEADAAEVNLIKAEWFTEQREKEVRAEKVRRRVLTVAYDSETEQADAVEVGHKIPKERDDPLGR